MSFTKWTWLVIAITYLGFFSWYTSFNGPLNPQEIEYYIEKVNATSEELTSWKCTTRPCRSKG
jgi:hypothetical protein